MKNKGFTLIELLAVIAIIAIISMIVTPNVMRLISESKDELYLEDAKTIISKAKYYYTLKDKYKSLFTIEDDSCWTIPLSNIEINTYNVNQKGTYDKDYTKVKICTTNKTINYYVRTKYINETETKGVYKQNTTDNYVQEQDLSLKQVKKYK